MNQPDLQPHLQGKRLQLRPLLATDFDQLYAAASDPLIWQQHPTSNRYQQPQFELYFNEAIKSQGALIVIDTESGKVIGSSRYNDYLPEQGSLEIGWTFLARSHWGGAYNKEMKQLMLRHAFTFVNAVLFVVGAQNMRSQRAVLKLGAKPIGMRENASGSDNVVYQLTKSDYLA
ncbi:MAG: GNAT family N-acetyltransferase [Oceanospirillaceae bacterium]|nr:GNAT family N-acetyltransferase [Oceanospirillaceae bacterium]